MVTHSFCGYLIKFVHENDEGRQRDQHLGLGDEPVGEVIFLSLPCRLVLFQPYIKRFRWPSRHLLYRIVRLFLRSSSTAGFYPGKKLCYVFWRTLALEIFGSLFLGEFDVHDLASQTGAEFGSNLHDDG